MPISSRSVKLSSPNVKIQDVPDKPTIGSAVQQATSEAVEVSFTPAATGGRAAVYRAISNPGGIQGISYGSSPVIVDGLSNNTAYTFTVRGETTTGATTGYTASATNSVTTKFAAMVPIATRAFGTGSIDFTNIPQNYQDLFVSIQMRGVNASNDEYMIARFNYTGGFSWTTLGGDGVSAFSNRNSPAGVAPSYFYLGLMPGGNATSGLYASVTMNILNYADTTKYKTTLYRFASDRNGSGTTTLNASLCASTAAITSISILGSNGSNGTATLYGIKAVGQ